MLNQQIITTKEIPNEIWLLILLPLPLRDFLSLQFLDKYFHEMVRSDFICKLKLESLLPERCKVLDQTEGQWFNELVIELNRYTNNLSWYKKFIKIFPHHEFLKSNQSIIEKGDYDTLNWECQFHIEVRRISTYELIKLNLDESFIDAILNDLLTSNSRQIPKKHLPPLHSITTHNAYLRNILKNFAKWQDTWQHKFSFCFPEIYKNLVQKNSFTSTISKLEIFWAYEINDLSFNTLDWYDLFDRVSAKYLNPAWCVFQTTHLCSANNLKELLASELDYFLSWSISSYRKLEVVKILTILYAADLNKLQRRGDTLLQHAIDYAGKFSAQNASILINAGINLNLQDSVGQTALHTAAQQNCIPFMKMLIDAGAKLNITDIKGMSPLHLICSRCLSIKEEEDFLEGINLLVNAGINVDAQDSQGKTALHHAAQRGHGMIVKLLIEDHNANVHITDLGGNTALHFAGYSDYSWILKIAFELIKHGANLQALNKHKENPVQYIHNKFYRSHYIDTLRKILALYEYQTYLSYKISKYEDTFKGKYKLNKINKELHRTNMAISIFCKQTTSFNEANPEIEKSKKLKPLCSELEKTFKTLNIPNFK